MDSVVFFIGGFGVAIGGLVAGLLMLVSPDKFLRLVSKTAGVSVVGGQELEFRVRRHWEWRIGGLVVTLAGAFAMATMIGILIKESFR